MFKDHKDVVVPSIYDDASSSRVITMSFEQGTPVG